MSHFKLRKLLKNTKSKLLLAAVILLVIGAGAWALSASDDQKQTSTSADGGTSENQNPDGTYTNLDPPTKQEKDETEAHKQSLAGNQPPATSSGKKQVYPVITGADHNEVRAYVSGVTEDGGICTFTFSKSGQTTVSKTSGGIKDAQTTICTPISPPPQVIGSGWTVVLAYSSAAAEGKSQASEVN